MKKIALAALLALLLGSTACLRRNLPDGEHCSNSEQCSSDHCIDGVCCREACYGGDCVSCAVPGRRGVCSPVPAGEGRCVLESGCKTTCDGSGACNLAACVWELPNAHRCTEDFQCSSGHCERGTCCATECASRCMDCRWSTPGTCSLLPAGVDPNDDCPLASCQETCDGSGGCSTALPGTCGSSGCTAGAPDAFGRPTSAFAAFSFCDGVAQSCPAPAGPAESCGLFACDGAACNTKCVDHSDCQSNAVCRGIECAECRSAADCSPAAPICDATWSCAVSNCVSAEGCRNAGFGSLCDGICQCAPGDGACNGRGPRCDGNPGACTCGADPYGRCLVGQLCTDDTTEGSCRIAPGFPCTADPADCASGTCVPAGVCGRLPSGKPCSDDADCQREYCDPRNWKCW